MGGSIIGDIIATVYFLAFQLCGLAVSSSFFKDRNNAEKLVLGSVLGSVSLQWVPVLFSFVFGFNVLSHLLALGVCAVLAIWIYFTVGLPRAEKLEKNRISIGVHSLILASTFVIFAVLVLSGFEIRNGVVYSSQATFGDMSMHLGFITSIAEQGTFPPEYSILPGTKLGYPFLSDSISGSLLVFGADIKFAYCLPMLFAGMQVFWGAWIFLKNWLGYNAKAIAAWILYFYCGGFGFAYFLGGTGDNKYNFTRIFTAFYETPTNLIGENIRWSNIIVDMLLPQRATLFGYAVLFTVLWVLYDAVFGRHKGEKRYFLFAGVLAGCLPMIHTHSLLALALVSASWLMWKLLARYSGRALPIIMILELVFFTAYDLYVNRKGIRESSVHMSVFFVAMFVFTIVLLAALSEQIRLCGIKELLCTWGLYLAVVCLLALPQLYIWTFSQTESGGFIRGYFNWANLNDSYLWFYIKNIGLTAFMFVFGYLVSKRRNLTVASPVLLIWFTAELMVFTPNTYDNNKLLYVGFIFMCGIAADWLVRLYESVKHIRFSRVFVGLAMVCCVISAVLTIGRELVAEYTLYDKNQMEAAEFIYENSEPEDTVLTDTRHNNAVASLTGRNIVCGSSAFLYYHGLDYQTQMNDARIMFENPRENEQLFNDYSVDYVLVSSYERNSYDVDEVAIAGMFPLVYSNDDVSIYKVN
ncbi:MAG: hypothetical protein Q4C42_02790 [Clostridia bacterium]|nr:hypothetical protein [Clostridia bacterium]